MCVGCPSLCSLSRRLVSRSVLLWVAKTVLYQLCTCPVKRPGAGCKRDDSVSLTAPARGLLSHRQRGRTLKRTLDNMELRSGHSAPPSSNQERPSGKSTGKLSIYTDCCTLCYALVLPGQKSPGRFRPESNQENPKIGLTAGLRPAGMPISRVSRLEAGRHPARKPDSRPGSGSRC